MAYVLGDRELYCARRKGKFLEIGVALCSTEDDLRDAIRDYNQRFQPRHALLLAALAAQFEKKADEIRARQKRETSDILGGWARFGAGAAFFHSFLSGTGKIAGTFLKGVKNDYETERTPFGYAYFCRRSPQADGTISVELRKATLGAMP